MVLGVVLLILITAVTWYFSRDRGGMQEGTVVIKAGDAVLGSFTAAELQKFPAVEKKLVITPGCGGDCKSGSDEEASSEHNYTGTPLLEVLNSIDPALTQKYQKVISRGIDYYSQVMEMSEIEQPDNVYIVYRDNGKPLKTKTGGDGGLLLVVCSDESGQRFTDWLVSLNYSNTVISLIVRIA